MGNVFLNRFKSKTAIGFVLLLAAAVSFPFVYYYFANFYFASLDEFKAWFPKKYYLIFPAVKVLPVVFVAIMIWLLYRPSLIFIKKLFLAIKKFLGQIQLARKSKEKGAILLKKLSAALPAVKQALLNLLLMSISTFIILALAEYALRHYGMKPGYRVYTRYFKAIDSLYNLEGFAADSNGIFHIALDAREAICNQLQTRNAPEELTPYDSTQTPEVYSLPRDFLMMRKPDYQSEFKSFLENLPVPTNAADSEYYQAIKDYVNCPINSNGFKSIDFKRYDSKRKSILLLGDSFTWGHSTSIKTNCFADLLLTKGYVVYNAGITGTDPAQYLQIAKVLVPQLQPDYVVVNFYMGNDIVFFKREPRPFVPVFYCTNAGNLVSCPEGIYFNSAQEAYEHTLAVYTVPQNTGFDRFCSKTVIGTLIWGVLANNRIVISVPYKYKDYYKRMQEVQTKTPYSDIQLMEIKKITEAHHGTFLLTVIPSMNGKKFILPEDKQPLFTGLQYYVPQVSASLYEEKEDGHYNDLGHKMHAAFIDSLIKTDN